MKFVPKKPNTDISETKVKDPESLSDISVQRLIDDGLLALHREMKNLLMLGSRGKLDAASSRDLRDTIKLLFELKEREAESLKGLTDEQLAEQAKVVLSESK